MTRVIKFSIDGFGIFTDILQDCIFYEEVPENWDDMTEDEQHEYASNIFKENVSWGWWEDELEKD